MGYRADHPFACERARWRGQNVLGRALMDVREGLRSSLHATSAPLPCSAEPTPTLTDSSRVFPTADGINETSPSPPQQTPGTPLGLIRLLYLGCPILGFLSSSILLWPFYQRSAL